MTSAGTDVLDPDEMKAALKKEIVRYREYQRFAGRCLKIRTKGGGQLMPLLFNRAQRFIHEKLEAQLKQTGMVRALILKGRQLGCSTYLGGRFYHKVTQNFGVKAFILTHLDEATDNLFDMVDRFHENNNPLLKPRLGKSNAKEMTFPGLDSGYRVGTAGSVAVGRSETIQLFHGSETAFWPNAESHASGVLQTVPDMAGTEVILESTGNGLLNYFAKQCSSAIAKKSAFQLIFVPWFWGEDYTTPAPAAFEFTVEEREYAEAYGLDAGQMLWRRNKLDSFGGEDWRFQQEYPANPEEALQSSGEGTYIKPIRCAKARRTEVTPQSFVPVIIGVDPARGGRDSTAVIDRQGRRAGALIAERWNEADAMVLAGRLVKLIQQMKPKKIVIDATEGTGAAIYDRLNELGYGKLIEPVKFSGTAYDQASYLNRRAEMWALMKEWLDNPVGVQIPNDDDLQAELCAPVWGAGATRHNSNGQLQIEPKEHIVKRLKRSPDMADALAMTFALPMGVLAPEIPRVNTAPADSTAGY